MTRKDPFSRRRAAICAARCARARRAVAKCLPAEPLELRLLCASQPYNWQNAAINGGGFVDGIFFSPTQQNVIYARTDIGGLYKTTNGGTSWNQLLDFVGSSTSTSGNGTQSQLIGVLSFAIDPENANNIYADVGEYSGTNGAVFYSTNGGSTWGQTNLSFYVGGNSNGRATGERIAVDPYDSSIVLLGSNANGLWESTNSGHSFSQVSSFSTTAAITFVEFKPYGGTAGSPTQNIIVGEDSTAGLSPQVAGSAPTNLYLSTNAGSSWSEIAGTTNGLGQNVLPTSITSLSRSGTTATVVTSSATGFSAGDMVTIAGATPTAYDGTFTITAVNSSTRFTYNIASGSDTATGTITATANYSLIPNRAVWASNGYIYLTYSDGLAPNGTQDVGGVFRYNTSNGAWSNISPQTPGAGTNAAFGYLGLALDPENNTTIAVTSINRYSATDALWRTTNASATSPSWVALYDTASAQNNGYGGYDNTRNTSNAAWIAPFGDGIGNWPATVAIDPFNSAHLLYGDGQGLWATNNATSTSQLTAANSWYFPDYGIEFTAVFDLIAPASGVPLFSAMGDISGFAHTTLTSSPAAGAIPNGAGSLDFDQANSNYIVELAYNTTGGEYSTNDGVSWTSFTSEAGAGGNSIAVSPAPAGTQPTLVWVPNSGLPYYSNNNGSTWTASTMPGGTLTGGQIISDRVTNGTFYYTTENSNDNQFSIYKSTNGGVSFTLVSQIGTGNAKLYANPFVAGDLWMTNYNGIEYSTNYGATFTAANGNTSSGLTATAGYELALGAPAPGRTNAAVYLWGEVGGITGLFRSDDSGQNYVRVNDVNHQWGGLVEALAADPNVFGRVYVGINGRGIIIGNPVSSLPTNWSDQDINTPGNPGFATSSTNLSNGTTVNQWIVDGGGAGITGTSDQFNFAAETVTGNGSMMAQITSLDKPGTGIPQAGVMFRAGTTAAGDPFAAILQTTANQLLFEYRTTSGGSISTTTLSNINIGSEYVEIVRSGNNFSAYYGTDGVHWTQLGSTVAISAIPSSATAGLAVTASYNPQLSTATFTNVQQVPAPTVTVTSGNITYNRSSYVPSATVTGVNGTDGTAPLTYTYYAGSTATGSPLSSAPTVAGTYTVIASFTGDSSYAAANSSASTFSILQAGTTIGVNSSNGSISYGQSVTFTATVTPLSGSNETGTVQFKIDGSNVGNPVNLTNNSATLTTSTLDAGSHSITAIYSGDSNYNSSTSSVYTQIVGASPLTLTGPAFYLKLDSDVRHLDIWTSTSDSGNYTEQLLLADYSSLSIAGTTGSDSVTADFSQGVPLPAGGLTDTGGAGTNNGFLLIGSTGNDTVTASNGQIVINSNTMSLNNVRTATFTPGAGSDALMVSSGNLMLAPPANATGITAMYFSSITLGTGARLSVAPGAGATRSVLVVSSLNLSQADGIWTSTLDLSSNDMVLPGGALATLDDEIGSGFNSGNWLGTGIASSAAASNTARLTALGVIQNSATGDPSGPVLYSSNTILGAFDGVSSLSTDVIIKYTYYGDANLDGKVDGTDYSRIDDSFGSAQTGWYNGDYNYDNVIDGSDYTLMDNAFNTQGANMAAVLALNQSTISAAGKIPVSVGNAAPAYLTQDQDESAEDFARLKRRLTHLPRPVDQDNP